MNFDKDDIVRAEIEYLNPDPLYDDERPYSLATTPPPGIKRTNIAQTPVKTTIYNARGYKDKFSLYVEGFEWVESELTYDLNINTNIDQYMSDMETLLRTHLHASRVIVYDYVFREQRGMNEPRAPGVPRKVKKQILGAHLDISQESAATRIRYQCGKEAEQLLTNRWHIVKYNPLPGPIINMADEGSIWRPLNGPVKSMPLALCDSRTLAPEDTIASDIVLPHLQIQAYEIWYNPHQRWHYLKDQKTSEVLLMMSSDSGSQTRCAHTAFDDPNTSRNDPKRNSVELRCMVFF